MKKGNIFIRSYSTKPKHPSIASLTSWRQLLEEYGCMKIDEINAGYDALCKDFTSDNLISFLDTIEKYFKDTMSTKISTVHEYIGKTDVQKITIEYEDNGGDCFVDYILMGE